MMSILRILILTVFVAGCSYQQSLQDHIDTNDAIAEQAQVIKGDIDGLSNTLLDQQSQLSLINQQLALINSQLADQASILAEPREAIPAPITEQTPAVAAANPPNHSSNKLTLGGRESIYFVDVQEQYVARIDTGAEVSSIHASNIEIFERDGNEWVRFTIDHEAVNELRHTLVEQPIKRQTRVRQANSDEAQDRYVVSMLVRLGEIEQRAEFTLADRSQLKNPILIGRDFFIDIALVDVSQEFIQSSAPGSY